MKPPDEVKEEIKKNMSLAALDVDVAVALGAPPVGWPQVPGRSTQREDAPRGVGNPSPSQSREGRLGNPPNPTKGVNPSSLKPKHQYTSQFSNKIPKS